LPGFASAVCFVLAKVADFASSRPRPTLHGQVGVDHRHGQRPADALGGGQFPHGGAQRLELPIADSPSPGTAQHGGLRHQQLVACQRDQRSVGPRFGPDKGHRPHLAGIQSGQVGCQSHAVRRRPPRAVDHQADKVDLLLRDLLANAAFDPADRIGLDRPAQVHANRSAARAQGRIFFQTADGQLQGRGQLQPVANQVCRQIVLDPQLGAAEAAQLAGGKHLLDRTHRRLLLEFAQFLRQHETRTLLRLNARDRQLRIEHPEHHGRGNRAATLGDLDVTAADRRIECIFGQPRGAKLGVRMSDDLLAGQHRQHGVPANGTAQISHRADAVQFFARQKARQRQRPLELTRTL